MDADEQRHRALANPVRVRLLEVLRTSGPMGVRRLSEVLDRHPNTVRSHLDVLGRAGLTAQDPGEPHGPGRPSNRYRALPARADTRSSALLAQLLADLADPTEAEDAALAWGRRLVDGVGTRSSADALDRLVVLLHRLGFDPQVVLDEQIVIETRRCAFEALAGARRPVACAVHRGLVRGALDALGGRLALSSLEQRDGGAPCRTVLAPASRG